MFVASAVGVGLAVAGDVRLDGVDVEVPSVVGGALEGAPSGPVSQTAMKARMPASTTPTIAATTAVLRMRPR